MPAPIDNLGLWLLVSVVGAFYAWIELLQRYEQRYGLQWRCRWVWAYLAFNVSGCLVAYGILQLLWVPTSWPSRLSQALAATVASWGVLRGYSPQSLSKSRRKIDEQFMSALRVFLAKADTEVEGAFRHRVGLEAERLMGDIPVERILLHEVLAFCERFAVRRTTSVDLKKLTEDIIGINSTGAPEGVKSVQVGMALVERYGWVVVREALESCRLRPRTRHRPLRLALRMWGRSEGSKPPPSVLESSTSVGDAAPDHMVITDPMLRVLWRQVLNNGDRMDSIRLGVAAPTVDGNALVLKFGDQLSYRYALEETAHIKQLVSGVFGLGFDVRIEGPG